MIGRKISIAVTATFLPPMFLILLGPGREMERLTAC